MIDFEMACGSHHKIIQEVEFVVRRAKELNDRELHGGYLVVASNTGKAIGIPLLIRGVGSVQVETLESMPEPPNIVTTAPWEYIGYALEKALRLASHVDHVASSQSRDDKAGMYPGAIMAGPYILSFDGLKLELNEAVVLVTAVFCDLLNEHAAREIAILCKNTLFEPLLRLCLYDRIPG